MTRSSRSPQRVARRRAEVLETARRLFAEEGIGAVTTGRIAQEAGISPGNLYYWFPSKAEIIRALFERWSTESRVPAGQADDPVQVLAMLWGRADTQQRTSAEYAFFQRELFPLLHADPVLAESYRRAYETRVAEFVALTELVIEAGLLRTPEPPATVRELIQLLWLVAETAAPFGEAVADTDSTAQRLTHAVIRPHLTDAGRAVLGIKPGSGDERDQRPPSDRRHRTVQRAEQQAGA